MANIRIKDLSTTASSTASDDFFGVDGATNGTRKLSAYSPTFGGNLTVSGTGGIQLNSVANLTWGGSYGAGIPTIAIPSATSIGFYPTGSTSGKTFELFGTGNATLAGNLTVSGGTSANTNIAALRSNYTGGASAPYVSLFGFADETTGARIVGDVNGAADIGAGLKIQTRTNAGVLQDVISFPKNTNNTTISGNLTVSGGTVTSGTGTLTLNSSANTVVLQSAGTTALTLDSSQNATFAGLIGIAGNTLRGVGKVYNSATGDAYGMEQVSGSQNTGNGSRAAVRFFSPAAQGSEIDFGYYSDASTYTTTARVNTTGITTIGVLNTQAGTASTPASASATGTAGTIQWDASYIYVCTATNTWKRVAIATW